MVRKERIRNLGGKDTQGRGPILYWMNRDCRIVDNWAYIHARELAHQSKKPLVVLYNLSPGFLGGGARQHVFKMKGLEEVSRACAKAGTPFFLCVGGAKEILAFVRDHDVDTVVTDYSPLRLQKEWLSKLVSHSPCPVVQVDAHNIVPVWVTSSKLEFAARTIRPKLARLAPEYLETFPHILPKVSSYSGIVPPIDWDKLRSTVQSSTHVPDVSRTTAGYRAGMKVVERFVEERLADYGEARNDANEEGQSGLSPYLHFGHIAPARVALRVCQAYAKKWKSLDQTPEHVLGRLMDSRRNGSGKGSGSDESFIEELIVRRELADNFCEYASAYDRVEGFPAWAQKTLDAHRLDVRQYLYSYTQLETARTHDALWNAAQQQLLREGTMHGYMRMYWGKKILEWSASPEEALAHAIRLNDTYQLDGRDPGGYVGIAWCIGGVHDRPWFNREIFGTVRYMARSGCEKKFDVGAYIARYS